MGWWILHFRPDPSKTQEDQDVLGDDPADILDDLLRLLATGGQPPDLRELLLALLRLIQEVPKYRFGVTQPPDDLQIVFNLPSSTFKRVSPGKKSAPLALTIELAQSLDQITQSYAGALQRPPRLTEILALFAFCIGPENTHCTMKGEWHLKEIRAVYREKKNITE